MSYKRCTLEGTTTARRKSTVQVNKVALLLQGLGFDPELGLLSVCSFCACSPHVLWFLSLRVGGFAMLDCPRCGGLLLRSHSDRILQNTGQAFFFLKTSLTVKSPVTLWYMYLSDYQLVIENLFNLHKCYILPGRESIRVLLFKKLFITFITTHFPIT